VQLALDFLGNIETISKELSSQTFKKMSNMGKYEYKEKKIEKRVYLTKS
jgi:hypothetical protein